MALYEIALLGDSDPNLRRFVAEELRGAAAQFGLVWGTDLVVQDLQADFRPAPHSASLVVVFGGADVVGTKLGSLFDVRSIPALPISTTAREVRNEIPGVLRSLNCLLLDAHTRNAIVPAILGSLGLLPEQRRVFLSYRRDDSTPAAVQLFAALSARQYQVFLDTHSISVAEDFQESLWHQLCDVDVLVMLETQGYFASRWTAAEYGRALSKGIGVLRVTWPDSTPNAVTGTASRAELLAPELRADGTLEAVALERILHQLERVRVTSHAARHRSLIDNLSHAATLIGGRVTAIGPHRAMHVELASGETVLVQPVIGVPTSLTLQQAIERANTLEAAVIYDHLGIRPRWQAHMHWLGGQIPGARWVKATEAAWDLAAWGAR